MKTLTGSEKQIAWAEKIRATRVNESAELMSILEKNNDLENYEEIKLHVKIIVDWVFEHESSDWWITLRNMSLRGIVIERWNMTHETRTKMGLFYSVNTQSSPEFVGRKPYSYPKYFEN